MGRGTIYPFVEKHLLSRIRRGMFVLETGCGAAKYRPIIQRFGARYFGTDVPNKHYQDPGDVDVYCSSEGLPFPDGIYDVVFNQGAIDYMPNIHITLLEAYRVLRPGGILLVYTYDKETLEMIDRNTRQSQRPWELAHHVFTEEEMLSYLCGAGFHATDETGNLDVWSPKTSLEKVRLYLLGKLAYMRRSHTNWRAFVASKPKR